MLTSAVADDEDDMLEIDDDEVRLCCLGKKWPMAVWKATASAAMLIGELMKGCRPCPGCGGCKCKLCGCDEDTIIWGSR